MHKKWIDNDILRVSDLLNNDKVLINLQNFQERYPNVHSPDFVTYNRIVKPIRDYLKI